MDYIENLPSKVSRPEAEEEVSRASVELLLSEPFFAHMLGNLPRVITERTPTAAVCWDGRQILLLINPDFFVTEINKRTPPDMQSSARAAILKHELLHIVFGHLFRKDGLVKEVENIASDLVVNQYIGNWYQGEGAVTLETFPDLELEPEQAMVYYYGKLILLFRELRSNGLQLPGEGIPEDGLPGVDGSQTGEGPSGEGNGAGEGDQPGANEGEEGESDGADEGGQSGSSEGDGGSDGDGQDGGSIRWTNPKDLETIASKTSAPKSAKALAEFLIGMRLRRMMCGDHGFWGVDKGAGKYQAGTLVLRAKDRMTTAQWGSMPGFLRTAIGEYIDAWNSTMDWKRILRLFCSSSYKTQIRHTMKRRSKRYGTIPGIKVKRFSNLLIAVDTSGSIDQATMESFFTEIQAIWIAGATITVIECDCEIHLVYEYEGKTPETVHGNGGTNFEPVFQWMQDKPQFDGFLYLTDGYAFPPETPPNCKMLWVIPDHCERGEPLPFGETLSLPSEGAFAHV